MVQWNMDYRIGMAPVDGVTDGAFRQITDEEGHPDFMYTEFVPTEGLYRGRTALLNGLSRHKTETPIIAQFFGPDPRFYSYAFFIAAELGFEGVDVNMGCPDYNIVRKGGGAALLLDLPRAKSIIESLRTARKEWENGKTIYDTDIPDNMKLEVKKHTVTDSSPEKRYLPISVKTRIGYHKSQIDEVVPYLIACGIDRLAMHGRTFDMRYSGQADWGEIAKAKQLSQGSGVTVFGNGDIGTRKQGEEFIKTYGVDGVLIARSAFGNPWVFRDYIPTFEERKRTMVRHAQLYLKFRPDLDLRAMRKHLSWYCKGYEGTAKLRERLMKVVTLDDLYAVVQ